MNRSTILLRIVVLLCAVLMASCGGRAFVHEPFDAAGLRARAESRAEGSVSILAAVPGRDETAAIFGVPLYDQGIQPVWLEIENKGSRHIRYTISSTDRLYFSPNEVAYKNRSGFSDEARTDMKRRFDELAFPRYVPVGETRSGFVFTHADTGAKGFNVDVFSAEGLHSFTLLLRVPGFVPDYANLNMQTIYSPDEIATYDDDALPAVLKNLPCCATDKDGTASGGPINFILVGTGIDLLKALLRSGWDETAVEQAATIAPTYYFGRPQDAIFHYAGTGGESYYELRAWRAPIMAGDEPVWAVQLRHFFKHGLPFMRVDPDVDNARNFAVQNFIYGQSLRKIGWLSGHEVVPAESFWQNLLNKPYFTDGYRTVVWLSPEPASLLDVDFVQWDRLSGGKQ